MPAARKWRVAIDHVVDHGRNCVVAGNIELFAVRGGPDVVPVLTGDDARVIFSNQAYDAAWHAFDDNPGSTWHDSCGMGGAGYIGWYFDAPVTLVGFSYTARPGGYFNTDSIETGGLEYYDEVGAVWVRTFSISTQSDWGNNETRGFFDPSTSVPDADGFRFWEICGLVSREGGYNGMSGCKMARIDGDNLAIRPAVSISRAGSFQAGSQNELFVPTYNPPGSVGIAQWYGAANGSQWFAADFGENNGKKIRRIWLYPSRDSVNRSWFTFEVAVWNNPDRSDRQVLQTISTEWVASTEQLFTLDDYSGGGPSTARRRQGIVIC